MTHRGPFQPLPFCDFVIKEPHCLIMPNFALENRFAQDNIHHLSLKKDTNLSLMAQWIQDFPDIISCDLPQSVETKGREALYLKFIVRHKAALGTRYV